MEISTYLCIFSGAAISAISCCQGPWWLYKSGISLLQSLLLQFGTVFLNTNLPLATFHNRSVDQVKWIFLLWHSLGILFQFEYIECVELACIDCSCHYTNGLMMQCVMLDMDDNKYLYKVNLHVVFVFSPSMFAFSFFFLPFSLVFLY